MEPVSPSLDVFEIIKRCKGSGIKISVAQGQLSITRKKGVEISDELLGLLKANKDEIIHYFQSEINLEKLNSELGSKERPRLVPLSYEQEQLWLIDSIQGSTQYHLPAVMRIHGVFDFGRASNAFRKIVERHEVLRTIFKIDGEKPYQHVIESQEFTMNLYSSKDLVLGKSLQAIIKEEIFRPFDLSRDYKVRVTIVEEQPDQYYMVLVLHHIAADGWSLPILVSEFREFYKNSTNSVSRELPKLSIQYADFSFWQRENLTEELLEQKIDFWEDHLQGIKPLDLPTDFARPSKQSINGDSFKFSLSKRLTRDLKNLSASSQTTLFSTLFGIYQTFLFKYTGQTNFAIGTPTANRDQKELAPLIGYFIKILTIHTPVQPDLSFLSHLELVKSKLLLAFRHQDVPFEKIVQRVETHRDMARSPLFQTMLSLQFEEQKEEYILDDFSLILESFDYPISKFDLTFDIAPSSDGGLQVRIEYSTDLFSPTTIHRMSNHFQNLCEAIVLNPDLPLSSFELIKPNERELLLKASQGIKLDFGASTVLDLIEKHASRSPESVAIVCEGQNLTYDDLIIQSNRLGNLLLNRGMKKGTIVPICIERSSEIIVTILAIWKAGGCYVPIEGTSPRTRIFSILDEIDPSFVISQSSLRELFRADSPFELIMLDELNLEKERRTNPETHLEGDDLAYIIYTSGTTGKPKGVMIEHQSLFNFIHASSSVMKLDSSLRILSVTNYTFDISILEFFSPLSLGGTVIMTTKSQVDDLEDLTDLIEQTSPSHIQATPSFWHMLVDSGWKNEAETKIICGGEPLGQSLKERLVKISKDGTLWGMYGPTEATIWASYLEISTSSKILLGHPLPNVGMYVLNEDFKIQPIGIPGEIYIGGRQLAKGYFKSEELSDSKFVADPFNPRGRLYQTGDIGKLLTDGSIEFLGRNDDQVKIRGHRIELIEIVGELEKLDEVNQAFVIVDMPNSTDARLVAYIVTDGQFNEEKIISSLKQTLPTYMIPLVYVGMEKLPLNQNGKVDRKALPPIEFRHQKTEKKIGPKSEMEKSLLPIWELVLNRDDIGIGDDFFQLGGHSVLAVRLVIKLRKELGFELKLHHVFEYQTIEALGRFLENSELANQTAIQKYDRPERIPTSYMQERLWFIHQLEGSVHYHIPAVLKYRGKLDVSLLKESIKSIVGRHEALRTVFELHEGKVYQNVLGAEGFEVETLAIHEVGDISSLPNFIEQQINKPFDLAVDFKIRLTVIQVSAQEFYLILILHHISADGLSLPILVSELTTLYQDDGENMESVLTPLDIQYVDFSIWQKTVLSKTFASQLSYWEEKLEGASQLELPTDHERPTLQSTRGSAYEFVLERQTKKNLEAFSSDRGTTLFTTLLGVYKILLQRHSSQQDICVGIPVANREHSEIAHMIGFFVNTLVIRSQVDGEQKFDEFLEELKGTIQEALKNQDVPFEKIVNKIVKERDASRSPLFQTMFSYQTVEDFLNINFGEGEIELITQHNGTSKFDLEVEIAESKEEIKVRFEFCSDLFEDRSIERFAEHFQILIDSIIETPDEKLGRLKMLSDQEIETLLYDFNDTYQGYGEDLTIVDLFRKQVQQTPKKVCLKFEKRSHTYEELDINTNRLAHFLLCKIDVQPNDLILIIMDRSDQFLSIILSTWKAGGAYVPIDPFLPLARIAQIVKQCKPLGAVISSEYQSSQLTSLLKENQVDLLEYPNDLEGHSQDAIERRIDPFALSYIIFTSGSTGQPKGAMIEHRGMLNHLLAKVDDLSLAENAIVAQNASQSFDISVWQFFSGLLAGGCTCVYSNEVIYDPKKFVQSIGRDKVNILEVVPTYLIMLLDRLDQDHELAEPLRELDYLMVTGETLHSQLVNRWLSVFPHVPIINAYGPTEASDDITHHKIESQLDGIVPIGKPVRNMSIYVLNKQKSFAGINVKGELYTSGVGVGRGYIQDPEKTNASFSMDPFLPNTKMYKTGDVARVRKDGCIEFFGRNDHQIKLRGYRIELQEIESAILSVDSEITSAVVLVRKIEDQEVLVGYYAENTTIGQEVISKKLKSKLPQYMVPNILVAVDDMPVTSNGKINRKALADISLNVETQLEPPGTETEIQLVNLLSTILEIDSKSIGVAASFFEIGGSSIVAFQLINGIDEVFGKEISIRQIFTFPTVRELATLIEAESHSSTNSIPKSPSKELYLASYAQERIFYHYLVDPESLVYNISGGLSLSAELSKEKLTQGIHVLMKRHTALRTSFVVNENGLHQKINNVPDINLEVLSSYDQVGLAFEVFVRPHDLENQASMIHFGLYESNDDELVLFIDLHHIICDGLSLRILERDLRQILAGELLPPLKIDYFDYAEWQRKGDHNLQNQSDYWVKELSGKLPNLTLSQKNHQGNHNYSAEKAQIAIAARDSLRIDKFRKERNITPFVFFLGIFYVLLHKLSGDRDLIIGTDVIGRTQRSIKDIVGTFVNILPLRVEVDPEMTFESFISNIRETVLEGFQNQDIQFDQMVKMVSASSGVQENPLTQVHFAYLDFDQVASGGEKDHNNFEAVNFLQKTTTHYEFKIEASKRHGEYRVDWVFRKQLLDVDEIAIFQQYYSAIISQVLSDPTVAIEQVRP